MKRGIFIEIGAVCVAFTVMLLVCVLAAWLAGAVTVSDGVVTFIITGFAWIVSLLVVIELYRGPYHE